MKNVQTLQVISKSAIGFFALGIATYALILPYLGFSGPIHTRLMQLPPLFFYMHTVGGAVALVLAPIQLFSSIPKTMHKTLGILYVLSVTLSSIGGLYMAQEACGGLSSTVALSLLACIWIASTYAGVFYAIKGERKRHYIWMVRSAALTFAAITLRLLSPLLFEFFTLYQAQQIIYWTCWPINLLIAECYLRWRHAKSKLGRAQTSIYS